METDCPGASTEQKLARYGTRLRAYLFVRSGLNTVFIVGPTLLMPGQAAPLILIASFVAILYLSKTFFGRPPVASARLAAAMQTQFNEADVDASGAVSFDEYYRHFFGKRGALPAAGATPASSPPPPPLPAQQQQQLVTSAGAVPGGSGSSFDNSYMRLSQLQEPKHFSRRHRHRRAYCRRRLRHSLESIGPLTTRSCALESSRGRSSSNRCQRCHSSSSSSSSSSSAKW